jgi:hypothetical protein
MSLRAFHIIFIIASVLLCLYVGLWSMRTNPFMAVVFFGAGAALIVYGKKAFRKLKELP